MRIHRVVLAAAVASVALLAGGCAVSAPGTVSSGPAVSAPAATVPSVATLGQTYTYLDGLAVSIGVDHSFDPGQYYPGVERGLTLLVTVTNNTAAPFSVNSVLNGPQATIDGQPSQLIVDPDSRNAAAGFANGTVLPGKTFTYRPSIGVGTRPGELQLEWTRDFGSAKAIFIGQG